MIPLATCPHCGAQTTHAEAMRRHLEKGCAAAKVKPKGKDA